ncbi:11162_t:CDS:2 [Scutellospora calospora]|uniref:11162_t:CDS:1 n=1 Tax=Scutellospora calospora TaxID=85575 RepID=A0ACA9JX89_9GLOM|nr:11162_t:CDS:2 [Scutellospora calospora]
MSQLSSTRYNVTTACDSCRKLKTRCSKPPRCTECIMSALSQKNKRRGPKPKLLDPEEINLLDPKEINLLDPEEINLLDPEIKCFENLYSKEQLSRIIKILNSKNSQPCQYKNIPGHNCHKVKADSRPHDPENLKNPQEPKNPNQGFLMGAFRHLPQN